MMCPQPCLARKATDCQFTTRRPQGTTLAVIGQGAAQPPSGWLVAGPRQNPPAIEPG